MKTYFSDILSRIAEPPSWYDENGTPRWGDFEPDLVAGFYANEAVLMRILCQGCRRPFDVAMSRHRLDCHKCGGEWVPEAPLEEHVRGGTLHYRDPPNIQCCASGLSMNSIPVKVLQFWKKGSDTNYLWVRVPELETDIPCDWMED